MAKHELKETKQHRFKRPPHWWIWVLLGAAVLIAGWVYYDNGRIISRVQTILPTLQVNHKATGGKIISQEVLRNYSVEEVNALARQNYGGDLLPAKNSITKRLIKYTSVDANGQQIEEYARLYLPRTNAAKVPLISLAPGTTGLGDQCAASLEQPAQANWANYESHAAAYAGQGYGVVITDYEGMRDSTRLHHYMVGELEGRAVLDAAKASYSLSDYKSLDKTQLFLAGYSQGGHAAAWADQLAASYTPDLKVKGLVAFAPVSDVAVTLDDIARAANIVWFGPFLLVSYGDYYQQHFDLSKILQPKFSANLTGDVTGHCISSVKYWTKAEEVYTPEFLAAMKDPNLMSSQYPDLAKDLSINAAWQQPTATPKLINQGDKDTIILPDQQTKVLPQICKGSEPVQLQRYPEAIHYTVMAKSYRDTLTWMAKVLAGEPLPSSCPKPEQGGANGTTE